MKQKPIGLEHKGRRQGKMFKSKFRDGSRKVMRTKKQKGG